MCVYICTCICLCVCVFVYYEELTWMFLGLTEPKFSVSKLNTQENQWQKSINQDRGKYSNVSLEDSWYSRVRMSLRAGKTDTPAWRQLRGGGEKFHLRLHIVTPLIHLMWLTNISMIRPCYTVFIFKCSSRNTVTDTQKNVSKNCLCIL